MFECFTLYQDCDVKLRMFREVWMIREMEVSGNETPCFRCHQVSCIAVYVEDHITYIVPDEGVRLRVQVIHELLRFSSVFFVGCDCALAISFSAGIMV